MSTGTENFDGKLDRIREEHARLTARLGELAAEIDALRHGREGAHAGPPPGPTPEAAPPEAVQPAIPPPLPMTAIAGEPDAGDAGPAESARSAPPPPPPPRVRQDAAGVEMVVGKVWLVRAGVLLLVVALVLFANFAYQHIISNLGPLAKWLLLFAAAGGLGLLGTGLQRRETMRRFGQALEAGGLAGCFYLLFAAHHVEALRWMESAVASGSLLLGWTAFMAWIADRRKSELLGGFSLLLAYTTCVVTPVTGFGLFAVLALSAAAVFFLLKNGWLRVPMLALPATYGMFALWQIALPALHDTTPDAPPETALACLLGYWSVFSLAGFLARGGSLGARSRAAFHLLNNTAVFLLGAQTLHQSLGSGGGFVWWAAGLGTAWLALACAASRRDPGSHDVSARVFLASGVVALTLAAADLLDGTNLAVVLAIEAAALAAVSRLHWRKVYLGLAMAAGLAAALIESVMLLDAPSGTFPGPLHAWLVALALAGAGWFARARGIESAVAFAAYWFCLLAMVAAQCLIAHTTNHAATMLALLTLGALLAPGLRVHRFRELAHASLLPTATGCISLLLLWSSERLDGWHAVAAFLLVAATGQAWLRLKGMGGGFPAGQLLLLAFAAFETTALIAAGALAAPSLPLVAAWSAAAFILAAKGRLPGPAWSAWHAFLPLGMAGFILIDHAFRASGLWWADGMAVVAAAALRPLALAQWTPTGRPHADQAVWRAFAAFARRAAPAAAVLFALAWSHACLPDDRLTVAWSLGGAALLVFGMLSGQSVHRVWGLGVLALAGLRLVFVDLWALGPLARVVSFLVLGAVLVASGFLYNRFGDRLRGVFTGAKDQTPPADT